MVSEGAGWALVSDTSCRAPREKPWDPAVHREKKKDRKGKEKKKEEPTDPRRLRVALAVRASQHGLAPALPCYGLAVLLSFKPCGLAVLLSLAFRMLLARVS
jgi:hypothetical protein